MSDFCEHETFKDICAICHCRERNALLSAEVERLTKALRHIYRTNSNDSNYMREVAKKTLSGEEYE